MDFERLLHEAFGITDAETIVSMVTIQSKYWWDEELGPRWIVSDDGGEFQAIAPSSLLDAHNEVADRAAYYELADFRVEVVMS